MSIKDLFGKKTVVIKNAESGSLDAESPKFVLTKIEERETFVPPVDFATASNFIRFGSAELYYDSAVQRIYSEYPYDGSQADKIQFKLSSSYFDNYILDEKYPKSTGYAVFNASGYGTTTKTNGYGLPSSTSDYEYIFIGGGIHVAPQKQHDAQNEEDSTKLYKKFEKGTQYEENSDKGSVFEFNHLSGSTIEFWLKKDSFDTTKTSKEVVLDLWNGQPSSSALYGRMTVEISASEDGLDPFRFTYQNGRKGLFQQSLASGSFTTASVADSQWHHYAISTKSRIDDTTNYLDLKFYRDGIVLNQQSIAITNSAGSSESIGNLYGRLDGYIGSLINSPSSSNGTATGAQYAGRLSASLDEVRFWKKRVASREIYNNWYHPIGGGANTDKYRKTLALYYKFNEGLTLTSSLDSVVLDYSGRVANGRWTGYTSASRNTGSCFVSASVLAEEPGDPIIRFNHPSVKALITEFQASGSVYDTNNTSFMYDMVPFWMREEDHEVGDDNLKKIYQILASYFDTLYLQIESLPDLKAKRYFTSDVKPYPFAKQLLQHNGLIVPDLFIAQGVLEKFSDRDDQNLKYEKEVDDIKKRIYYNIYNNLKTIYESKGTEKSYRNLLRCFGIDDEIVKLNLYTDNGINYLTDKVKYSSHKTKFINHNHPENFTGRVFNTSSVGNAYTFISSSGPAYSRQEKNLAFTLEADIMVPKKRVLGEEGYFPTDFVTSSIMGFHSASIDDPENYTWYGTDLSNLQVHLVRPVQGSPDAKFVITNADSSIFAESETIKGVYDNQRWALGLKVYPNGYPFIGTVATASNPTYIAELYGVTHTLNDVQEQFTITASMNYDTGSAMLYSSKRFYAGCEALNFTSSTAKHPSDIKIAACRLWYDKLDNAVLKQHNLDASNYGHNKIHGNPTPYVSGLENVHIPSSEVLAFNWDFQQVTTTDSDGRFVVEDFSSGTSDSRYGWIDNLILRNNRGRGFNYATSSTNMIDNEFIFSAKKELPEISFTSDGVFIKGEEEELFGEDEDTTDNVFAFEKSMYQVLSEEILKTFSTVTEYANLFMKPVDHYREEYKRLDHFKEVYFERVSGDLDFEKFTNYFKFIDATISVFIQQLHPAMAKFNEGISDMVESHILERPKYKRQFPFVVTRDTIPDGKMSGIGERVYPWKEGHAPNYREVYDENDHCFWQKERAERTESGGSKRGELNTVIVSEVDGKSKNLGTSDRQIYQGSTYAVRSFGRQYRLTYTEQKTIHGGTNYGNQKNRDFVLDHLKPHGGVGSNSVPQEVITVGVGKGLGIFGLDKCKQFTDPYETDAYSIKHRDKAEYRFFGTVGRYADGSGDQPKSDDVDELFKVRGHHSFPFNLVSGTISTGYNSKISGSYDDDFILTNLHSDTTTPSNDVPMQGPFAEAWVGGRQFRHIPMNRYNPDLVTSGGTAPINKIDDQFTRPEGYRILVGDHPSEPVSQKDGALGMVGPDYGGPYPNTTRQMAVHYREERAKRPFNLKNIKYTTGSAIHGNFRENYEIISAVGRKENNLRFREFVDVSASLQSAIGALLPQTTNQASLYGSVPHVTGNVFGLGNSNLVSDLERIRALEVIGVKATGSIFFKDHKFYKDGQYATGIFNVSGASILTYSTGSFNISASHQPGEYAEGFVTFVPPNITVSSGSFQITGATIPGVHASSSFSVDSMIPLSVSTGSIRLSTPQMHANKASGSITVNALPSYSYSSGSFEVTGAYISNITASGGGFTISSRTIFKNQYTGSFKFESPPRAPRRGYAAFDVKGTTVTDGHTLTLNLGGTSKVIETDTNGSTSHSPDIVIDPNNPAFNYVLHGDSSNPAGTATCNVGTGNYSVSFWWFPYPAIDASATQESIMEFRDGGTSVQRIKQGNTNDIRIWSYPGGAWFDFQCDVAQQTWVHIVLTFNRSTGEFLGYKNGDPDSDDQSVSDAAGMAGSSTYDIDTIQVNWDEAAFQDLVVWDKVLSASEAEEIYNEGAVYDYADSDFKSNIINWWKMGYDDYWRDIGYTAEDTLDTYGGDITRYQSSSYGDLNHMSIANTYDGDIKFTASANVVSPSTAKTNVQIWDELKSDLNSAFSGWNATYRSGSTEANFYIHKQSVGASGATVSQTPSGASFTAVSSSAGRDALASVLKHGDNITIEGDQFDIFTTTSGSSVPHINAASSHRKALRFKNIGSDIENHAYNLSYANPTHATKLSVSWWMKLANIDGTITERIWEFDNGGNNHSWAGIMSAGFVVYLYDDTGAQSNAVAYKSSNFSASDVGVWKHYTLVWSRTNADNETPILYVNGVNSALSVHNAGSGWANTNPVPITKVYIGDNDSTGQVQQNAGLQDFVIWDTDLSSEDAKILYNSGSWHDIHSHVSASSICDWWMLGGESNITQASGSHLAQGTAVTTIEPAIGRHNLTFNSNSNVIVTRGLAHHWKQDDLIFDNLQDMISNETPYTAQQVQYTTSGNVATFQLVTSSSDTPTGFTESGDGFHTLVNPAINGQDTSAWVSGPKHGDAIRINTEETGQDTWHLILETNTANAGSSYAKSGTNMYVYASASTDTVFWNRVTGAMNAMTASYNTTHAGSGEFDFEPTKTGPDGNCLVAAIVNAGGAISSVTSTTGGRNENNTGQMRVIKFTKASASLDSETEKYYTITNNMAANQATMVGLGLSSTHIVDGVSLLAGTNDYYLISSTGSARGSSGTNDTMWGRLTASIKHGFNVQSGLEPTMKIEDIGSAGGRIEITGAFKHTNGHNHTMALATTANPATSGDNVFTIFDPNIDGYGFPTPAAHNINQTFSLDGITFEFVHPHDNYAKTNSGNIPVRPTSSRLGVAVALEQTMSANVPTYVGFQRSLYTVSFTASAGGVAHNGDISDSAEQIVHYQTVGGTDPAGAGDRKGFRLNMAGGNRSIYSATSSATFDLAGGSYLSEGVYLYSTDRIFVSATGSDPGSDGDPTDFWNRMQFAINWAIEDSSGTSATVYTSGSSGGTPTDTDTWAEFYITGALTASNSHDITFVQTAFDGNADGDNPYISSDSVEGYGAPLTGKTSTGHCMVVNNRDGKHVVEQVFPWNNYSSVHGVGTIGYNVDTTVKATGSLSNFVIGVKDAMKEMTNYDGQQIQGNHISFTASLPGGNSNIGYTTMFSNGTAGSSTPGQNVRGFAASPEGAIYGSGQYLSVTQSTTERFRVYATNGPLPAGTFDFADGIKRENASPNHYWVSTTSSTGGTDTERNEGFVRRIKHALLHGIGTFLGDDLSGSINIASGSAADGFTHHINFTGSLTASNGHDLFFEDNGALQKGGDANSLGYGRFTQNDGTRIVDRQQWQLNNGAGAAVKFEFVPPADLTPAAGHNRIITTGSWASIVDAISGSILQNATNYTIKEINTAGLREQFVLRANVTGSLFNSDYQAHTGGPAIDSSIVYAVGAMSGGYNAYGVMDQNWVFIGPIGGTEADGSGARRDSYLFKLDHDANQPAITLRTHSLECYIQNHEAGSPASPGKVFSIRGELVTGSTTTATTPSGSIVMMRGATYRFYQTDSSNSLPIVFSTSSIDTSGVGMFGDQTKIPHTYYVEGVGSSSFSDYAAACGDGDLDYVEITPDESTPNRIYYGGEVSYMGGIIHVMDRTNVIYVDASLPYDNIWKNLTGAIETNMHYTASYRPISNQGQAGTDTDDSYLPAVQRAEIVLSGSTNLAHWDDALVLATGSSWELLGPVTGAMIRREGLGLGEILEINWGRDPYRSYEGQQTRIATSHPDGTNPLEDESPSDSVAISLLTGSVFTGSTMDVTAGSAWHVTSSGIWNKVSASINRNQFSFTTSSAPNGKYKTFTLTSKHRTDRYNFTGSGGGYVVGLHTSSGDGHVGFDVVSNMAGGNQGTRVNNAETGSYIEFQNAQTTIRIQGDVDGFDGLPTGVGSYLKFNMSLTGSLTDEQYRAQLRHNLSKSINRIHDSRLVSGSSVPMYQIGAWNHHDASGLGHLQSYQLNLTSTVTGTAMNFVGEAFSGQQGKPGTVTERSFYNAPGVPYNFMSGGVNHRPLELYNTRVNVNRREQAVMQDGRRQKTVIMSRFYGGGGPEVMTEAFLDVYAKERSVYSALPFRNLTVKNDSGEKARTVHFADKWTSSSVEISVPDSIRVSSHANRREGLNTLHSRHCGRFGLDSRFGDANWWDYREPSTGGTYEPSFHKFHRNTKSTPLESRALRFPKNANETLGLFSGQVQTAYPSVGKMALSCWIKLDRDWDPDSSNWIVEADSTINEDIIKVNLYNGKFKVRFNQGTGTTKRTYTIPIPGKMTSIWTHFVVAWDNEAIETTPRIYVNTVQQTVSTEPSDTATGAAGTIGGRMVLMRNDVANSGYELQGSMQDFAWYHSGNNYLSQAQINEIYDNEDLRKTSLVGSIIDYWPLGSNNVPIGAAIPAGTKILPAIGSTTLTTPSGMFAAQGRGKAPRHDNFYVQSILPQSDYNYSWVETSLGSNYSVRSGRQKVFGYWPKDGILIRNIEKGAKGTYYETQVIASTFESAINFPTGSDIHGS